jgi:hypothetical protein
MPVATGTEPKKEALSGSLLVEDQTGAVSEPEMPAAPKLPTCIIKNIKVTTEKI